MVLKFGTIDSLMILNVVIDINNEIPYMKISRTHKISCYYIKKIYKHFHTLKTEDDIRSKIKNIEVDNNVVVVYPRDNHQNYENHKKYYNDYVKSRRLRIRLEKAQKLIDDNSEPVKDDKQEIEIIN